MLLIQQDTAIPLPDTRSGRPACCRNESCHMTYRSHFRWIFVVSLTMALASPTLGQTGVSDDRVSLPDGPGSLDGIGDNVSVNGNMGQMSYNVSIDVPAGFPGVTPSLSLNYSSGGGNTALGIGWSMDLPYIERMTSKGLPEYVDSDRFVADGGTELVRVSTETAEPYVYRSRFEGAFVRYQWHERGNGDEGYFTAEYPDGRVGYFGADESGNPVESGRVRSPDGVFRYLLMVEVDTWGHALRYDYSYYGSTPLVDFVGWAYDGDDPGYAITFDYESRQDRVSDARGGFNELLAHRMTNVHVWTGGTELRRYTLSYEDYATSGGFSRLTSVEQYGHQGNKLPIVFSFEYQQALGGACDGPDCQAPYLVDLGNIGGNVLASGLGTLMDMNGDSLPDLIVSSSNGDPHQIYLSELSSDGTQQFLPPYSSSLAASGNFVLSDNTIQALDYDGDGLADLIDHITGQVLVNKGEGDWSATATLNDGNGGTDTSADGDFADADAPSAADGELRNIKYFDYDGDRKIDILRAPSGSATQIIRNLGDGGYEVADGVQDIGATFEDDNLELADMNGDGLLDPVKLSVAGIEYKLNLGRGRWSTSWTLVENSPLMAVEDLPFTSLEDMNGDGIDDIVVVDTTEIRYALNRNGARFDPVQTITGAGNQAIPQRVNGVTVLFADMNGNGSNDVVWVEASGNVTYLELFPERPNLLSRIENGIGLVSEIRYSTSIAERARDQGNGWDDALPNSMIVVKTVDSWARAPTEELEQRDRQTYTYRSGYYDGVEKAFRGFADVLIETTADQYHESASLRRIYDVGAGEDRAEMAGRELRMEVLSASGLLKTEEKEYELCPLSGVPSGLSPEVRFVCLTRTTEVEMEALPASRHVTMETTTSYDGYGNPTSVAQLGVTSIGGGGCEPCEDPGFFGAPCGSQCTGDERYQTTTYADPEVNDNWLLRKMVEQATWFGDGTRKQTRRYFYDGPAFRGLPLGRTERGGLVRVETDTGESPAVVQDARHELDEHGNVLVSLNPEATEGGDDQRSISIYSADGLDLLEERRELTDEQGRYSIRRRYTYDPLFGKVATATNWYVDDNVPSDVRKWFYDEFGRPLGQSMVGSSATAPSEEYAYELGSPFSRTVTRRRFSRGGAVESEEGTCLDGFARKVQTRTLLAEGRWLVSGYTVFDRAGNPVRTYQPFESDSGACASETPSSPYTEMYYDAQQRLIRIVHPDQDEQGGVASERRIEYEPLTQIQYLEDDLDSSAPGFDTPNVMVEDGLGRTVRVRKQVSAGAAVIEHHVLYDDLGEIAGYRDADGNRKVQQRDLQGRIVEIDDPNAGRLEFEYDINGNVTRQSDAAGRTLERTYDQLGRMTAEWDPSDREGTLRESIYDRHPDCAGVECANGASRLVGLRYSVPQLGVVNERFGYDDRGFQTSTTREMGGHAYLFEAAYDEAGRLVEETFPDGRKLQFTLDKLGRITAIEGYVSEIRHHERGQIAGYTLRNGVTTSFEQTAMQNLARMSVTNENGAVTDLRFAVDRRGYVSSITDALGVAGKPSLGAAFTYDGIGRLVRADLDGGENAGGETERYVHDSIDRLVSKTSSRVDSPSHVGELLYGADSVQAVSKAGDVSLRYDAAGAATQRGDDEFSWDARGRLETLTRDGATLARYGYSSTGLRMLELLGTQMTMKLASTYELRDGVARLMVQIDGVTVVEEDLADTALHVFDDANDDGAITSADAWLARSSLEANTMLRSSARRALAELSPRSYVHTDHIGSVVALTDDTGAVSERFTYHPWGTIRSSTANFTESAGYAGHRHDETGLLDFGARTYSPREGRWLSPDPLFSMMDENALGNVDDAFGVYSYASANPSTQLDEGGTYSSLQKVGIGAAVAVALAGAGVGLYFAAPAIATTFVGAWVAHNSMAVVGAVVQGVVAMGGEIAAQRAKLAAMREAGETVTGWTVAGSVAKVVAKTLIGAASGFLAGASDAVTNAIAAAATAAITYAEHKTWISPTDASLGRMFVTSILLKASLTSALAAGTVTVAKLAIAGTVLIGSAIFEAATLSGRKARRAALNRIRAAKSRMNSQRSRRQSTRANSKSRVVMAKVVSG